MSSFTTLDSIMGEVSILSKTILQILYLCCFLEVKGASADADEDIRSNQGFIQRLYGQVFIFFIFLQGETNKNLRT